jgi:hypothetical protein
VRVKVRERWLSGLARERDWAEAALAAAAMRMAPRRAKRVRGMGGLW